MAVFSANDLLVLENINNVYGSNNSPGIEFSSYAAVSYPGHTNPQNDNYTGGPISGKRYAGCVLFDTLYGNVNGQYCTYTWKTGWEGNDLSGTSECKLVFGIVPIFWSSGNDGNSAVPSNELYKTGSLYDNTAGLKNFVTKFFGQNNNIVSTLSKAVKYYKVVEGQADADVANQTAQSSDSYDSETFELLTISNAIGLGSNIEFFNNYKSCDLSLNTYGIINHRKDERYKWWTVEQSGLSGKKWLPDYMSIVPRIGAIPTKYKIDGGMAFDSYVPTFGYFRSGNQDTVGILDTTNTTYLSGNGQVKRMAWNQFITQQGGKWCDDYFGDVKCPTKNSRLNEILNTIATLSNPTDIQTNSYIADSASSYGNTYNMYEYSTLAYEMPSGDYMHVLPIFANSIKNLQDSTDGAGGPCCLINTFQSIIYNTYNKDIISTANGFGWNDTDMQSITAERRFNRTTSNQTSNTYLNYINNNKFIMKYDSATSSIYINYALKVTGDVNGNPTGIVAGKTMAADTDWIAWINGNLYVIPNEVFTRFVYYTKDDLTVLNGLSTFAQ